MDERIKAVKTYYDLEAMLEWERFDRHPYEFALTTYMMEKYVKAGDSVLDIGGGPGRYSIHFAKKGCDVTLVDLSEGNIALAGEMAKREGVNFTRYACNCLELDKLPLGQFDHVFLMGPLYHLQREEDRINAVKIALSHLKPGGIFYCSFILDFAGIIFDLKAPGVIMNDVASPETACLIDSVVTGEGYTGPAFTSAHFINQRKILPFMEQFSLEKLHLFGQEGILSPNENTLLACPAEEQAVWLEIAKKYLELPELLAFSEHAMYVGRK